MDYLEQHLLRESITMYFLLKSVWHKITQIAWSSYNKKQTIEVLKQSRKDVSKFLSIPTRHWLIEWHVSRLGRHSMHAVGGRSFHHLWETPILADKRSWDHYIVQNPVKISEIKFNDILKWLDLVYMIITI